MLNLLKAEANRTYTENGAATYVSTESYCLDLFATIGALRNDSDADIIDRFIKAYAEDRYLAMKMLFYARDVRGGLGERRVFRTILGYLAVNEPDSVRKNIAYIAEYGRFDDLLTLLDTPCEDDAVSYIRQTLDNDIRSLAEGGDVSLLGKWLPSANASNRNTVRSACRLAKALGMTLAQYRKTLSALRAKIKIIENDLREKDYTFEYEKQPSKALYKYRKAFIRNDCERYNEFITRAVETPSVMHTGTLTPYDVIRPVITAGRGQKIDSEDRKVMDATWNALEDFAGSENSLVVVDGSGSMYCGIDPLPAAVAQSLGIYFAERNTGAFHNHFITFSTHPRMIEIKGRDIVEKVRYCMRFNECCNTDLERTFELILDTAVRNGMKQSDMPETLYIISDMEFDYCVTYSDMTIFENAGRRFEENGYRLPKVVFWNVNSRNRQQPVRMNERGVILVSGSSPRVFEMIQNGAEGPYRFMMDVLSSDRYGRIAA